MGLAQKTAGRFIRIGNPPVTPYLQQRHRQGGQHPQIARIRFVSTYRDIHRRDRVIRPVIGPDPQWRIQGATQSKHIAIAQWQFGIPASHGPFHEVIHICLGIGAKALKQCQNILSHDIAKLIPGWRILKDHQPVSVADPDRLGCRRYLAPDRLERTMDRQTLHAM